MEILLFFQLRHPKKEKKENGRKEKSLCRGGVR